MSSKKRPFVKFAEANAHFLRDSLDPLSTTQSNGKAKPASKRRKGSASASTSATADADSDDDDDDGDHKIESKSQDGRKSAKANGNGDGDDKDGANDNDKDSDDSDDSDSDSDDEAQKTPAVDLATLSPQQRRFVEVVVRERRNVFLTGSAGCGKSLALIALCQQLRKRDIKFAVTAPTGIAASHLCGLTIYTFMGLGLADQPIDDMVRKVQKIPLLRTRWQSTQVLIIDEVSMLDPRIMQTLNDVACAIRQKPQLPFGGMCVVCSGDFAQLPPVKSRTFCFELPLWKTAFADTVLLQRPFRQNDLSFLALLSRVRCNQITKQDQEYLESKIGPRGDVWLPSCLYNNVRKFSHDIVGVIMKFLMPDYSQLRKMQTPYDAVDDVFPIGSTELYANNADVDSINLQEMARLQPKRELYVNYAVSERRIGENTHNKRAFDTYAENMRQHCLAKPQINLCTGAQVMLVANVDVGKHLVNGARGVITGFANLSPAAAALATINGADGTLRYPVVRFINGQSHVIPPYAWIYYDSAGQKRRGPAQAKRLCAYVQVPLKLSWAITVHKSQGLTLDRVFIKLGREVMSPGQAYTALSRVTGPQGLTLERFERSSIRCDPRVTAYYKLLEQKAAAAATANNSNSTNSNNSGSSASASAAGKADHSSRSIKK